MNDGDEQRLGTYCSPAAGSQTFKAGVGRRNMDRDVKLGRYIATTWRGFPQSQRRLIAVLAAILAVVGLLAVSLPPLPGSTATRLLPFVARHLDAIDKLTNILVHGLTVLGAIIGAVWAYYRFAGARTFARRVSLDIDQLYPESSTDILVFRLTIMNIGQVRVIPETVRTRVDVGRRSDSGTIEFEENLLNRSDLLQSNFDTFDPASYGMEPTAGMDIDFCIPTQCATRIENGDILIRVRARLTAATQDFWERTKIFVINVKEP
jgi:hypothetical protein